jgi:carbon monoxide dehydrogenase subunit G
MKGEMRCHVSRSAEDVFDFLADLRNESRWNPRVVAVEQITPGLAGTGTRFHGRYRGIGTLDTVLVECDRPRRVAFRSEGPRMEIEGAFTLTPAAGGTDVFLDADLRPSGVLRYIAPFTGPLFRRQNRAAAERLEAALRAPTPL